MKVMMKEGFCSSNSKHPTVFNAFIHKGSKKKLSKFLEENDLKLEDINNCVAPCLPIGYVIIVDREINLREYTLCTLKEFKSWYNIVEG